MLDIRQIKQGLGILRAIEQVDTITAALEEDYPKKDKVLSDVIQSDTTIYNFVNGNSDIVFSLSTAINLDSIMGQEVIR